MTIEPPESQKKRLQRVWQVISRPAWLSPELMYFILLSYYPDDPASNFVVKPYEKSPVLGPYASSNRVGKTCTALLGKRNDRSYDKLLVEWVRSCRVRASWPEPNIFLSGRPTQSVSIYHLPKVNVQDKNYYDPGFLSWGMLNYIPRVGVPEVVETFLIEALR